MDKKKNVGHVIKMLCQKLDISEIQLAGLVGLTAKSLDKWRTLVADDYLPSKAKRILRLKDIIDRVERINKDMKYLSFTPNPKNLMAVLSSGRVEVDSRLDDDESSVSLLGLVNLDEIEIWDVHIRAAIMDAQI